MYCECRQNTYATNNIWYGPRCLTSMIQCTKQLQHDKWTPKAADLRDWSDREHCSLCLQELTVHSPATTAPILTMPIAFSKRTYRMQCSQPLGVKMAVVTVTTTGK